ncbi:MAG: helix-turn-helix domain-containing protein [Phenylobacterium sp.]
MDGLNVSLILAGRLRLAADGREAIFGPGDIFAEDTTHPRRATNEFLTSATLFIPKARFTSALAVPSESLTIRQLRHSPLADSLAPQIRFLAANLEVITPYEFEAALEGAIQVALALLRTQAHLLRLPVNPLLTAARAYVEEHFHERTLGPEGLARALGCSRAALYRAFAGSGQSVGAYLQDMRFRRFLAGLRSQQRVSLSRLAYDSGFACSYSDFSKMFKRAYGMTPSEARARLLE